LNQAGYPFPYSPGGFFTLCCGDSIQASSCEWTFWAVEFSQNTFCLFVCLVEPPPFIYMDFCPARLMMRLLPRLFPKLSAVIILTPPNPPYACLKTFGSPFVVFFGPFVLESSQYYDPLFSSVFFSFPQYLPFYVLASVLILFNFFGFFFFSTSGLNPYPILLRPLDSCLFRCPPPPPPPDWTNYSFPPGFFFNKLKARLGPSHPQLPVPWTPVSLSEPPFRAYAGTVPPVAPAPPDFFKELRLTMSTPKYPSLTSTQTSPLEPYF